MLSSLGIAANGGQYWGDFRVKLTGFGMLDPANVLTDGFFIVKTHVWIAAFTVFLQGRKTALIEVLPIH